MTKLKLVTNPRASEDDAFFSLENDIHGMANMAELASMVVMDEDGDLIPFCVYDLRDRIKAFKKRYYELFNSIVIARRS